MKTKKERQDWLKKRTKCYSYNNSGDLEFCNYGRHTSGLNEIAKELNMIDENGRYIKKDLEKYFDCIITYKDNGENSIEFNEKKRNYYNQLYS